MAKYFVIWKCSDTSMQGSYDSTEYVRGGVFGSYRSLSSAEKAAEACRQSFNSLPVSKDADYCCDVMVVEATAPTYDADDKNSFGGWYGHAE